jgi:hypothetical protein
MCKIRFLFPLLLTSALCAYAQDEEDEALTAEPIKFTLNLPSIEGLPQKFSRETVGCEITYFVPHDRRINIENDSLKITSVTNKDGKDISKDSRGRNAWKFGGTHTSTFNRDTYTTFSIFIPTETPLDIPVVKGTLTAKVAGKTEAQFLNFKTDEKGVEQKVGPFTISIKDEDNFAIHLKGDTELLSEISLSAGGQKIHQRGSSSSMSVNNGVRTSETTYTYPKPTTLEFTLTVTFFTEMKDVSITLGQ